MWNSADVAQLKCFIVNNQYQLILAYQYGIDCNVAAYLSNIQKGLKYLHLINLEECVSFEIQCEIKDFLKRTINSCKQGLKDCQHQVLIDCGLITITDNSVIFTLCNSITLYD